jgi:hypothetical protein
VGSIRPLKINYLLMKTTINIRTILLSILVLFAGSQNLLSQVMGTAPIFQTDVFIILKNGDTINGSIVWRMKYIENNPYEIKFTNHNGDTEIFDAGMINGFATYTKQEQDEYGGQSYYFLEAYESKPSPKKGEPVFLNRFLDGRMKVFMNRSSMSSTTTKVTEKSKFDGIAFSFSPGEGLTIGPSYKTTYNIIEGRTRYSSYFVEKERGSLVKVSKDNYDGLFPSLFGDCPAIQKELEKNPDLKLFKNFMILAEVYDRICY